MTLAAQPVPSAADRLDQDSLEGALRAADPRVMLVPAWLMTAVITRELDLMPTGLRVPDEALFVLPRSAFARLIDDHHLPPPQNLPPAAPAGLPDDLVLLARPDDSALAADRRGVALTRYWRLLVRAAVEANVRRAVTGELRRGPAADADPAVRRALDERIDRIGHTVFNEARHVLAREHRVAAYAGDLDVYAKFAAAFLDLRHFAPGLIDHVIPSAEDPAALAAVFEADAGSDVVAALRPPGAADPSAAGYQALDAGRPRQVALRPPVDRAARQADRREAKEAKGELLAKAERAADNGNDVRAAILKARAHRGDRTDLWFVPNPAARSLDRLVDRLQAALGLDGGTADEWREALRPLLGPASLGWWSAEGRLLYDLQRVCVDAEREVYSVNVVEWVLELFRRPLYRQLPLQKPALIARHLKAAEHRLTRCRLPAEARHRLEHLFHAAVDDADHALRVAVTPRAAEAFEAVGMTPRNAVEAAARQKITQEMADTVLRDGYLNFAGVRDTISRNVLRCEDLRNPIEWVGYDQLMRLDRQLGDRLDGVYHRGEIYRYLFQKFSSWLFATPASRFLTTLVVMPVVGATILVAGVQFVLLHLLNKIPGVMIVIFPEHSHDYDFRPDPDGRADWPKFIPTALMAVFLLLVINWPAFRRGTGRAFKWLFRQIAFALFELPERLLRNPVVRWLTRNPKARLVVRWGIKPLAFALVAFWLLPHNVPPVIDAGVFVVVFLIVTLVVNSPPGRAVEEAVLYALRVGWVRYTADTLAQAVRGVMRFFERMLEAVDRMLYAVDEWLRFRSGQRKRSLVGKAILGVIWFYIAYAFRFGLNLLFEPQVNPIKHFPVVTVSHKLLLPLAVPGTDKPSPFGGVLMLLFPLSRGQADATAATVVWGIPGIFGFLAWELKENWKLYRANLPAAVRPVHFGSHGESVAQLLRPGFHSGTLPKAFAKLRKAHRLADGRGRAVEEGMEFPLAVHKPLEAVHHVHESVDHFVKRAFLALLNRHPAFADRPISLAGLTLGPTRVQLVLAAPAVGPAPLRLSIEQVNGWVVARTVDPGWTADLAGEPARLFAAAVRGFYKMSAVDVVREDVDRALAGLPVRWELRHKQLVVRPTDPSAGGPALYWLHERVMRPLTPAGDPAPGLPVLGEADVLFRAVEIPWGDWVSLWGGAGEVASPGPVDVPARSHGAGRPSTRDRVLRRRAVGRV